MTIIEKIEIEMAMRRRHFIKLVGSMAASWPAAARAQQHRIPIVGFVGFAKADDEAVTVNAFRKALVGLGHVEGRTIMIDARSAGGDVARGHAMIDELMALPVDVFLSPGPAAARAIVRKTNIPVVAVALPAVQGDPELFQSLSRPGGSVTGFSAFGEEISAKRIEMLKEIIPGLKKLGVMHNATDPTFNAWGSQTIAYARRPVLSRSASGLARRLPSSWPSKLGSLPTTAARP